MHSTNLRRISQRVALQGYCGVVTHQELRPASVINLSAEGIRLERPFDPERASRMVELEIEVPGIDEVIWARGAVAFAHLTPMGGVHKNGQPRLWCRAGVVLTSAAQRDLRLLRDAVTERARRVQHEKEHARHAQMLAMFEQD